MDQQLMYDFLTAPVLDLTLYQIDSALQAMTDMPESVGGDFATNLDYVFNNLKADVGADEVSSNVTLIDVTLLPTNPVSLKT